MVDSSGNQPPSGSNGRVGPNPTKDTLRDSKVLGAVFQELGRKTKYIFITGYLGQGWSRLVERNRWCEGLKVEAYLSC